MKDNPIKGVGIVLLIIVIWLGYTNYQQGKHIEELQGTVSDCSDAVDNANQNIDDLNSQIEDAQSNAWSDYDTMGDSLDNLTQGEDVDNPCFVPDDN